MKDEAGLKSNGAYIVLESRKYPTFHFPVAIVTCRSRYTSSLARAAIPKVTHLTILIVDQGPTSIVKIIRIRRLHSGSYIHYYLAPMRENDD